MSKSIVIGIIALLVIGIGGYFVLRDNSNNPAGTSRTQTATPPPSSDSSDNQPAAATITYTDDGFSPSTTTVKSGDTVAIKNASSSELQMDSDPHPTHTDDMDLNVGPVAVGQTKTFIVTKTGTFGIHNHLNPSNRATIIIR